MQRKLTRRHGGTERIILENTFSYRSQVARILQQLTFVEMEETFAVPLCRRVRPLSRDVTHLSVLATSANIPNAFATINMSCVEKARLDFCYLRFALWGAGVNGIFADRLKAHFTRIISRLQVECVLGFSSQDSMLPEKILFKQSRNRKAISSLLCMIICKCSKYDH